MKAAVTDGKGRLWLTDVPVPKPGPYECLCRIEACPTCTGTDQKHIQGKLGRFQQYPGILGHESVGVVVETGAHVRHIRKGDRYLRPTAVYWEGRLGDFFSAWGGFAEYGLVTDMRAMKEAQPDATPSSYAQYQMELPSSVRLSAADATSLITLKETAGYVASAGVRVGSSVLILGSGAVAFNMCWFAKVFGAHPVIVAGRRDEPLAYARERVGADATVNMTREDLFARVREATDGKGVDLVIDTTGQAEVLRDALPALTSSGKAAAYASYENTEIVGKLIPADRLLSAATGEILAHPYMLDAVRLGLVKPSDFYSHRMPFERICEGFDLLRNKKAFKIVFEMENA
jgi:threonine dehydrogenase-like Zn-dependent dehydrogenase